MFRWNFYSLELPWCRTQRLRFVEINLIHIVHLSSCLQSWSSPEYLVQIGGIIFMYLRVCDIKLVWLYQCATWLFPSLSTHRSVKESDKEASHWHHTYYTVSDSIHGHLISAQHSNRARWGRKNPKIIPRIRYSQKGIGILRELWYLILYVARTFTLPSPPHNHGSSNKMIPQDWLGYHPTNFTQRCQHTLRYTTQTNYIHDVIPTSDM